MSNLDLVIKQTEHSFTTLGPLSQDLSMQRSALFNFDLSLTSSTDNEVLTIADLRQASLSGLVVNTVNGTHTQSFTLNKESGAANSTVAAAIEQALGLKRVGETAILKFYNTGTITSNGGALTITSDDTSVLSLPLTLFSNASEKTFAVIGVVAVSVTAGSESVRFFVLEGCDCITGPTGPTGPIG